jgi:hypothetical protein
MLGSRHVSVTALAVLLAASCADETPAAKPELDVVRTLYLPGDPCDVRNHAGKMKLHVNIASNGKVILPEALQSTFSDERTACFLDQIRQHRFNPLWWRKSRPREFVRLSRIDDGVHRRGEG